jgi:hypothetical protein
MHLIRLVTSRGLSAALLVVVTAAQAGTIITSRDSAPNHRN